MTQKTDDFVFFSMNLPSPKELKEKFSLPLSKKKWIENKRKILSSILAGHDPRIALVCGPCSLHNQKSALEFGLKLKELQNEVKDSFYLIMRAYIEKPRTSNGWKGILYGMKQKEPAELLEGLHWSRETLLRLTLEDIPLATEFLDPLAAPYFEDLITWGFIGSRTSLSQTHRQLASSLSMPVGFKNTPDGSILNTLHSIKAAQGRHLILHIDESGKLCAKQTAGNPHTHLVLRGSDTQTNYDSASIAQALDALPALHLAKQLIVDCSHGNSRKNPEAQKEVFQNVMQQIADGNTHIRGAMLESHLESGNQPPSYNPAPSLSLTDPCLSWDETRALILAHAAYPFSSGKAGIGRRS